MIEDGDATAVNGSPRHGEPWRHFNSQRAWKLTGDAHVGDPRQRLDAIHDRAGVGGEKRFSGLHAGGRDDLVSMRALDPDDRDLVHVEQR